MVVSLDGSRVYVAGISSGVSSSYDYATVAYDAATWTEVWTARYNGPANREDDATRLVVGPDGGRVFVTGYSSGGSSSVDYATVAYDAVTGTEVWTARYNGPANADDVATDLIVSLDGSRVYVTGYSNGGSSSYDFATGAYDAATGLVAWGHREVGRGADSAFAVGVSPDGSRVLVTGANTVTPEGRTDFGTIAYAG